MNNCYINKKQDNFNLKSIFDDPPLDTNINKDDDDSDDSDDSDIRTPSNHIGIMPKIF